MNKLQILSLLPAATEIVYLLGLEKYLIGISDDCDFPPQVRKLPKVTECLVDQSLTSWQIDQRVKNLQHQGMNVSHLDENLLKNLKPTLILTQDICSVCAVSYTQIQKAARILDAETKIISLEPESIIDILENIKTVGRYTDRIKEAEKIISKLWERLGKIKKVVVQNSLATRRKVLVIEWLDPTMVAGHWVPEMVEKAGGEMLITKSGERSFTINLNQIRLNPDVLVISPCGFDIDRTLKEKKTIDRIVQSFKNVKVYLVDGNSYMTRPGPRIIDGVEILSEILHTEVFKRKYSYKSWVEYK